MSDSLLVDSRSKIGRFMLDELRNHVQLLRGQTRSWSEDVMGARSLDFPVGISRQASLSLAAVMFDLDGVLYDSLPHYVEAWTEAFKTVGISVSPDEVYRHEGRLGFETVARIAEEHGQRVPNKRQTEDILEARDRILARLGPPTVMPGARELVSAVVDSGVKLAVVTGSSRVDIRSQLERDFSPSFDAVTLISGLSPIAGKPAPEPYLSAIRELAVHPLTTVVIENAPLGLTAAARAGCYVVGVNTGVLSESVLLSAGARVVFSSCGDLASAWPRIVGTLTPALAL